MRLEAAELATLPGIAHGFFGRQGGVSGGMFSSLNCGFGSGDHIEDVSANREIIAKTMGHKAANLCSLRQVHGLKTVTVNEPWTRETMPEADAMVTNKPGIQLGILTADCVPVLFADPGRNIIGAAHAGWKGAIGGIVESTVKAMQALGAETSDIVTAIGPCIRQKSYEVDQGFKERFCTENAANTVFFLSSPNKPEKWQFDIAGYVSSRLMGAGIQNVNMLANDTCFEEDRFFSFRRATLRGEKDYGRQISVISLV